jgi:undecaprenyl-diphosphatase
LVTATLVIAATAAVFLWRLLSSRPWRAVSLCGCVLVGAATVVCRTLSGVHWLTDILGACLLSAAIVLLYALALQLADGKVGAKKE